jgi:hypothetical protein
MYWQNQMESDRDEINHWPGMKQVKKQSQNKFVTNEMVYSQLNIKVFLKIDRISIVMMPDRHKTVCASL